MMEDLVERVQSQGYRITFNPKGDGNCFYAAAAFQLNDRRHCNEESLKEIVFTYLQKNQLDASKNK